MDDLVARALAVVMRAEEGVRDLIEEAANKRSYGELPRLAQFAESLAELGAPCDAGKAAESPRKPARSQPAQNKTRRKAASRRSKKRTAKNRSPHSTGSSAYPKFVRQDEVLVKIGFSTKSNSTYEHRAPRNALSTVAERALDVSGRTRGPFTAEALSDLQDHADSQKLPGYQLYLCLAWLKSEGLIKQHGRKGYSVKERVTFEDRLQQAWDDLEREE